MFFVRTATPSDLAKVQTLLRDTWHATYDDRLGVDKAAALSKELHSLDALKAQLARPHGEFLVADDGRQLGGMAYAAMAREMVKTAMLYQLYVHPDYQRQGIGRDLFAELETCFPDADVMRLEVDAANAAAIGFYTAHGFIDVDHFEREGVSLIVMEKPLG